jgi:hypothetical protein
MKRAVRSYNLPGYVTIDFKTSHLQHLIRLIETSNNHTVDQQDLTRLKITVLEQDFYNSLSNGHSR